MRGCGGLVGEVVIFQSPEATAVALQATEDAQKRLKACRVRRPIPAAEVNHERLLAILRPMVNRFLKDGYRATPDNWRRLARELTRD